MGFIYILQSEKNGRYYIGSTNNVERRLSEHNSGKTKSLKKLLPLRLVFEQKCETLLSARRLERKLKKLKSRHIIERIVRDQEIKAGR